MYSGYGRTSSLFFGLTIFLWVMGFGAVALIDDVLSEEVRWP